MWKDYLHFSQGEKRGILVLSILIVLVISINLSLPLWLKSAPIDFTEFKAQVDAYYLNKEKKEEITKQNPPQLTPFLMDTVSSDWLKNKGLPVFVANNLIAYRDKKGTLHSLNEVKKIYGMTDSILTVWEPFFIFTPATAKKSRNEIVATKTMHASQKPKMEPEFQVDINTADTAIFKVLYGIGPSFAERIVKYRSLLGGYVHTSQILEVYGMDSARFLKIAPYLNLDTIPLRKIKINQASIRSLKGHPYLNFYQAKRIYEYRRDGNWIDNWGELLEIENLDTANLSKIRPYLTFEIP